VGGTGKDGKSQGIVGSANAIDVWVWMRLHIRFCTIGNCDLLSFFSVDRVSQQRVNFIVSFFSFLKTWSFSTNVSPFFLFNPCSLSFFRILLLLRRDSTHWNFLGDAW
jgi:hypothetical protein